MPVRARLGWMLQNRRCQVLLVLAAVGFAVLAAVTVPSRAEVVATDSGGAVSLEQNGLTGRLVVEDLVPGVPAFASVTLRNTGLGGAGVGVRLAALESALGTGGGDLARGLQVTVDDAAGATLWRGGLAQLGGAALGTIGGGDTRTFRLGVVLPDGGAPQGLRDGDNAYQSARVSFDLTWGFDLPSPTAALPAPSAAPPPAAGVLGERLTARTCVSRRLFKIRLLVPTRARPLKRAEVLVGRRRVAVIRGRAGARRSTCAGSRPASSPSEPSWCARTAGASPRCAATAPASAETTLSTMLRIGVACVDVLCTPRCDRCARRPQGGERIARP